MPDKRGSKPGERGQIAHQHNELAASLIRNLRSHGLPIKGISQHLEWLQAERMLDLGAQGYSVDTIRRHYRLSLDVGALPTKHMLMQIIAQGALGEELPEGVSKDVAYRAALDSAKWMLEKVHGVGIAKQLADTRNQIPIDLVREVLTIEEIDQLERIMGKLQRAMDPSRAIVNGDAAAI